MTPTPELEAVARAILDATVRHNCAIIGKPYHPEQYDEFDYARAYENAQAALDALRPYRDAEIKAVTVKLNTQFSQWRGEIELEHLVEMQSALEAARNEALEDAAKVPALDLAGERAVEISDAIRALKENGHGAD